MHPAKPGPATSAVRSPTASSLKVSERHRPVLLVDTNILLVASDTSTRDHKRCAAVLDDKTDLAVSAPVAVVAAWMIESHLGSEAESKFVASIADNEHPSQTDPEPQ